MKLETVAPDVVGFNASALDKAVQYAVLHESAMKRDIAAALSEGHFGEPWPLSETIGPTKPRDAPSGIILRHGKVAASWGDTQRVDMTFSVSKSFLAILTGIAVDDGLIGDVNDPVRLLVEDGGFDSAQNRGITWAQLLQLTSEWSGTLWSKPDTVDHGRDASASGVAASEKGRARKMLPPGSFWEYNDVRVNRLALALLRVFKRPLPDVLKERIMDPIGASTSWEWHGYRNSYVEIDGQRMQSVSGGAHWGGGLWISSEDQARVGVLMAQGGVWNGQRLLSASWVKSCVTPCSLNDGYGYLWWLNTKGEVASAASAQSFFALGVGSNVIWVDPETEMVVVARWIEKEAIAGFAARVMAAVQ